MTVPDYRPPPENLYRHSERRLSLSALLAPGTGDEASQSSPESRPVRRLAVCLCVTHPVWPPLPAVDSGTSIDRRVRNMQRMSKSELDRLSLPTQSATDTERARLVRERDGVKFRVRFHICADRVSARQREP